MASRRVDESVAQDESEPDRKRAKPSSEGIPGPYEHIDPLTGRHASKTTKTPLMMGWRLDPEQSFSDWTIIIQEIDGPSTTYHVHKCVLASASDYFRNVFHSTLAETSTSTSKISLEGPAAKAIPSMLDYMYAMWMSDQISQSIITKRNAVSLRYLAQYFHAENLFLDATQVISQFMFYKDVQLSFLEQAMLFQDETLTSSVIDAYARKLRDLKFEDLASLSPALIVKVLNSPRCQRPVPFKMITKLCDHYADEKKLDWTTFKTLTSTSVLGEAVLAEGCLKMLKYCLALKAEAEAASDVESWKAFHDRCMSACTRHWKSVVGNPLRSCDETQRQMKLQHRQLPLETQVLVLENALAKSVSDVAQAQEQNEPDTARAWLSHTGSGTRRAARNRMPRRDIIQRLCLSDDDDVSGILDDDELFRTRRGAHGL